MLKVEVIGNLGADAEVKESNGSKFVSFRVAHTDKWTTSAGEKKESTSWIDCTMNNVESKVIPYLKAGVKVFLRGSANLRVYSSPKERQMKAGLNVAVSEVELCGGLSELVPRQLILPETGQLVDVTKHYWCNLDTKKMKADERVQLIDQRGNSYALAKGGWITPVTPEEAQQAEENANGNQAG